MSWSAGWTIITQGFSGPASCRGNHLHFGSSRCSQSMRLLRSPRTGGSGEEIISVHEETEIPVIRVSGWADRQTEKLVPKFDGLLNRFRERPGIIIDVRGNGGGEDELAAQVVGRFISKPVIASISF